MSTIFPPSKSSIVGTKMVSSESGPSPSWPSVLLPHTSNFPVERSAKLWVEPAASEVTSASSSLNGAKKDDARKFHCKLAKALNSEQLESRKLSGKTRKHQIWLSSKIESPSHAYPQGGGGVGGLGGTGVHEGNSRASSLKRMDSILIGLGDISIFLPLPNCPSALEPKA